MGNSHSSRFAGSYYYMVRHIAPYPVGEVVKLTSGETAVVIKLNEGLPIRPVVRVIKDEEGNTSEQTSRYRFNEGVSHIHSL